MYADIDSNGRYSVYELNNEELLTMMEALRLYNRHLEALSPCLRGNEFIWEQKQSTDRLMQTIKSIL